MRFSKIAPLISKKTPLQYISLSAIVEHCYKDTYVSSVHFETIFDGIALQRQFRNLRVIAPTDYSGILQPLNATDVLRRPSLPFLTMEYWNFLFSLANCFGMDSKHSRILDLSASSAYLTISSSYPAIRLRCFLYMSSIFLVSRKHFTTSGSPPTITYLYSSSIIAL